MRHDEGEEKLSRQIRQSVSAVTGSPNLIACMMFYFMFMTMKVLTIALIATLVLLASAEFIDLSALALVYPNCSLSCMTELIPQTSCVTAEGLNQTCVCTHTELNQQIALCASQRCHVKELLTTKNASTTACGAPVRDHSSGITILGLSFGGVAYAAFIARISFRLLAHQRKLFMDDWTMLAMVVVSLPPTILAPFLADNGLGRDMWTLPFDNISNVLEFFLIGEVCYLIALALNKISLLFFFLRIFPDKRLRKIIYFTMALCVTYGIAFFFSTLFQCLPIKYMWLQWDDTHNGSCNDFHLQGWLAAGINIALDIVVMVLPLRELAKLNMSRRKKVSIIIMFLTGTFVIVVSCVRLKYLFQFRHTQNPTFDYLAPGYWSLVEIHVGTICACMPAIYGLLQQYWPRLVSGTILSGSKSFTGRSSVKMTTVNSDHHVQRQSTALKGSRDDNFILLHDIELDAATEQTQNSDWPLKK